jgi:hypothetical protein
MERLTVSSASKPYAYGYGIGFTSAAELRACMEGCGQPQSRPFP